MDSRAVTLYAHELGRFLLPRRIASMDKENVPLPRDNGAESKSHFSGVVGSAILIICHRSRHIYWTQFVEIEDMMLQNIESFVSALAIYACFLHSNYSGPVDSLLQFSALLLELVAFADAHGRRDYAALFPMLWEMNFLKFHGDSLPDDLNSRAAEFLQMHSSEVEMNAGELLQSEPRGEDITRVLEPNFNPEYEGETPLRTTVESEIKSAAECNPKSGVQTGNSKQSDPETSMRVPTENITECKKEFATILDYAKTGAIPKRIIRTSPAKSGVIPKRIIKTSPAKSPRNSKEDC